MCEGASRVDWKVPAEVFSNALERSAEKAFAGRTPSDADLDRYYDSLHLADLALACACAMGREDAWDHFVKEFRPAMYRAADAMDPGGGARDIAQALYAELFGLKEKDGVRQSVFRYFHGRSSLADVAAIAHRAAVRRSPSRDAEARSVAGRELGRAASRRFSDLSIPIARDSSRRCAPCWPRPLPRSSRAIASASPATMRRR